MKKFLPKAAFPKQPNKSSPRPWGAKHGLLHYAGSPHACIQRRFTHKHIIYVLAFRTLNSSAPQRNSRPEIDFRYTHGLYIIYTCRLIRIKFQTAACIINKKSFLPTPRKPRRYSQGSGCGGCDGGCWSEARLWGGVVGALWRAADDDDRQMTSLPSTLSRLDLSITFAPPVSAQWSIFH